MAHLVPSSRICDQYSGSIASRMICGYIKAMFCVSTYFFHLTYLQNARDQAITATVILGTAGEILSLLIQNAKAPASKLAY